MGPDVDGSCEGFSTLLSNAWQSRGVAVLNMVKCPIVLGTVEFSWRMGEMLHRKRQSIEICANRIVLVQFGMPNWL